MSNKNIVRSHWKRVKCPFFHSDNSTSINCEGVAKASALRQIFSDKAEKVKWQEKFCFSIEGCNLCPIHKLADEKYS